LRLAPELYSGADGRDGLSRDSPDSYPIFVPEFFNVIQPGSAGCIKDGMMEGTGVLDHDLEIFSQRIELFLGMCCNFVVEPKLG
jgi:hypothetical protein